MADKRKVGPFRVNPIGLGCMSLSHAYGTPPDPADSTRLLNESLDLGYDFLDTAAIYGAGANERLLGAAIGHRRGDYVLASKCGISGASGQPVLDGRPETLHRTLDEALLRLRTDIIDLYYLHRWDKKVPIEDSVGALGDMVTAGKVRAIGLSEISAATLRKAHAVHPIAAVQNEYSPWSRNVELGLLATAKELGVALVAFSPTGRGFLAGRIGGVDDLAEDDLRRSMPRFQGENFDHNRALYARFGALAAANQVTPAQLSLAWLLTRGDHVIPIPGTTSLQHLRENFAACAIPLPEAVTAEIDALFAEGSVAGARYTEAMQAAVDTEQF